MKIISVFYGMAIIFTAMLAFMLSIALPTVKKHNILIKPIYIFIIQLILNSLTYTAATILLITIDPSEHPEPFLYMDVVGGFLSALFPLVGITLVKEKIPWVNAWSIFGFFICLTVLFWARNGNPLIIKIEYIFLIIYVIVTQSWVIINIRKQASKLSHFFDNPKERNKSWFIPVAIGSTLIVIASLPRFIGSAQPWFRLVVSAVWAGLAVDLSIKLLYQKSSHLTQETYKKHSSRNTNELIAQNLEKEFVLKRYYLNAELTLDDLAKVCKTNRTYMGNYLKEVLHVTFSDYVNSFRIKEADVLLSDSTISLEAVALNSGFNNTRTFRRSWEKAHGEKLIRRK